MKDEIKEIIDRLERIDHKEYIAFEFADNATFDEMARCFEERKKMAKYITNLQEERNMYKVSFEEMSKNYFEEQSRIDKAIEYINKELKNMPINGCYQRLAKILFILGSDKDE